MAGKTGKKWEEKKHLILNNKKVHTTTLKMLTVF
jgi:hypothetical protein